VSPTNIGTGGPTGVDDNYLRLTSIGGSGGGSRLTALNVDWSGNWLAAGITHVRMDANNFGNSDVMLRLLFEDPMGAAPTNMAISANGVLLAAGSGWQSLEFDLFGPSGLLALFGSVDAVLTNTTVFRIVHSSTASFPGEPVIAQIGVDNITAVSTVVPEPSSMVLFAVGALTLMIVRRRTG
jgi:hypothetical protein